MDELLPTHKVTCKKKKITLPLFHFAVFSERYRGMEDNAF